MRENWTCHMLMADVIVDTTMTCMYISIDAMVDIRLAKLVIYLGRMLMLTCMYISVEAMVLAEHLVRTFW